MRKIAIIAATAVLLSCWGAILTYAADKNGPATLQEIINAPGPSALRGCYFEAGLAGTFFAVGERTANGSIGGGCNVKVDKVFVGGIVRGFFGEAESRGGSVGIRMGFAVNPHADLYVLGDWRAVDFKLGSSGQFMVGGGAEIALPIDGLSAFAEASTAVSKWGAATKDDVATIIGLRWRFK